MTRNEIYQVVWDTFQEIKRYSNFQRVRFQKLLQERLPGADIWVSSTGFSIKLGDVDWRLSVVTTTTTSGNWAAAWEFDLLREDRRDYDENAEFEAQFFPELERVDKEIAALQAKAASLKPDFMPPSVRLRNSAVHWAGFSYDTRCKFPHVFPGRPR